MAAGAVPVVFGAAGPAEIVHDGVDGLHWSTLDQLADETVELAADDERRRQLAEAAVRRAADFSADVFANRLGQFVADDTSDPVTRTCDAGQTRVQSGHQLT